MIARVKTSSPVGLDGLPVVVECDLTNGLPGITIVGLGAKAVDEAKERVKSALLNSSLQLPRKRITINLSPADTPKDGSSFDLAIALAILSASNQVASNLQKSAFIGELSLDGTVQPVPAIISHVKAAIKSGCEQIYVPIGNAEQASLIEDIKIMPVKSLREVYFHLENNQEIIPQQRQADGANTVNLAYEVEFQDISGQAVAKRALEIAAAGHHNILMTGPPGTGKTMLAKALLSILPPLKDNEVIDVTNLHSLNQQSLEIIYQRPFRSPHHTASQIALVGGGRNALPGEISLAHQGVLFLDELPEHSRSVLEALRQPLEDGVIDIARANQRIRYPADFMLVATQNPCPCGYYNDEKKTCVCSAYQIQQYQKRISGPLLDRIDLIVSVDRIDSSSVLSRATRNQETTDSNPVRQRVLRARNRQLERQRVYNSQLSNRQLKRELSLDPEAESLLVTAAETLDLSPRAIMRTLKVGRTIADLENKTRIDSACLSEALQYRLRERQLVA